MRDAHISLADGRELAFTDIGRSDGPCTFYFHGAPMSRLHLVFLEEQFSRLGLRVVSPDRPGYGRSSPQPGRSMADWAADVAAVADVLGIERFMVAGHSSGGPYAVTCCALLPGRVSAGAVFAGVTDMAWPEAWNGYTESEAAIMHLPDERAALNWCTEHMGEDGSRFLAEGFDLPAPDVARLADETFAAAFKSTVVEAFRQGVGAYAQDAYVQGRPWPFDARRISVPVAVVHGEPDTLIPMAHSRHTAALIPGATLRTLPGHGHQTIVSELPSILSALAGSVGAVHARSAAP